MFTKLKSNSAEPLKARQIRAATSCEGAYQETLTPQFQECLDYLGVDDGEEYSSQQLDSFCNRLHCTRTIGPVYRDIAVLCDENVSTSCMLATLNSSILTSLGIDIKYIF